MNLQSQRLVLSPWHRDDSAALRPIATDVEVMRYITGGLPWSDEQIQSFVDDQIGLYSEKGFCRWKLVDKQSGDFVGFCGTGFWRNEPDPEIGWWLSRLSWGRGLATEAARVAMADAFERVNLKRIISIARPKNFASIRIMHKLGLKLDSEFERDGVQLVKYALDRCDYAALPV